MNTWHIQIHTSNTSPSIQYSFRLWFLFLFFCIVRYLLLCNSKLFVMMLKFHCSIKFVFCSSKSNILDILPFFRWYCYHKITIWLNLERPNWKMKTLQIEFFLRTKNILSTHIQRQNKSKMNVKLYFLFHRSPALTKAEQHPSEPICIRVYVCIYRY